MSDQPILYCPNCNHVCKSLRGLAQHTAHRPGCRDKARPYFADSIPPNPPSFHQSFVQLNASHADQEMEPIWQQEEDPSAFDPPYPGEDPLIIDWQRQRRVDSEMHAEVSLHQNNLDAKISQAHEWSFLPSGSS